MMTPQEWEAIDNFYPENFKCPCCGKGPQEMDRAMVRALDNARDKANIPFVVTSAYRCPDHNAEVGGVASSAHVRGYAVDIKCDGSRSRHKIVTALKAVNFHRIGVAKDFVHADKDPDKPALVLWVY